MENKITLYGDGIHDDTAAIQAMLDLGGTVKISDGAYRSDQRKRGGGKSTDQEHL